MYLSSKKHILTNTLIAATVIQFISVIIQYVIETSAQGSSGQNGLPDASVWSMQHTVTSLSTFVILIIFFIAIKKVKSYIGKVDKEDRAMMGRLQEDNFGEDLSALPADMIHKLLFVWGVILAGTGLIETLVLIMYRKMIVDLNAIDSTGESMKRVYSSLDGFENLTVVFTLLIGVIITAVILENRQFTILSVVIALLLLIAFCIFNVRRSDILGFAPDSAWISIVFNIVSTAGMIIFALYLRKKYRGV